MAPPHWLTVGGATKTPEVVVTFDTETKSVLRGRAEVLTLRCWDALVRHRPGDSPGWESKVLKSGESAGELVDVLEAAAAITGEAWGFAHNAGFDLTVTSLPMVLSARGWEPDFVNIGEESCVFVMKRDGEKLVITDTWSWLRCSLQAAAKDVAMRKVRLPEEDDSLTAWHKRCAHDVKILDALLCDLLGWWDRCQLGAFAVTGASCGWRTMRKMIDPKTILVGTEEGRTAFEREAIFGGRKEVWQVGRIRGKWVEDWDLATAHLQTVASRLMPVAPIRGEDFSPPLNPLTPPQGLSAVVRCEIRTRVPCAPCKVGEDVWWAVGTFRTTLTSPELVEVVKLADHVKILKVQWYRMGDALRPWAQWCKWLADAPLSDVPLVVKRVAKGWGRSVPGRFALRTSELIMERPATHLGWSLETGNDLDTGAELEILTYGGVERTYRRDQDGADCSPVILAFVEGYVRAAMAQTLAARAPEDLLQCNTDGWWEVRPRRGPSSAPGAVPAPYSAVRKAVSRDVTVHGPNHITIKGDRRLSGVPKDAAQNLSGAYTWQDWPGLRWQLQNSRPGEYVRPGRTVMLADHYCRRWVLSSGETCPVSVSLEPSGANRLEPWSLTSSRWASDVLAEHQVAALQPLANVGAAWVPLAGPPSRPLPGRRSPEPTAV
jgi:hypothetical protein